MVFNPDMPDTPASAAAMSADHAATAAARAKIAASDPELAEAIKKGYEPHDIGLRGVFVFLITLVITMIVVLAAMWGVMMLFVNYDRSNDPIASPVKVERPPVASPLQPTPQHPYTDREDVTMMRDEADRILTSSGTTPTGRHYIKISDAMDHVRLPIHAAGQQPSQSQGAGVAH
jgi:hypothetical protein